MKTPFYTSDAAKASLQQIEWQEGARHVIIEGPYRHKIEIVCSSVGRQRALFANGDHSYFAYVRLGGTGLGACIVPVLPDGRLLMVVEQRPAQGLVTDRRQAFVLENTKIVDLAQFGPYSSVEFPGGIEPGESVSMGSLREVAEEVGLKSQPVVLCRTSRPHFTFGSDATSANFLAVAYLSDSAFAEHVSNDGGLKVLALNPREVQESIWSGVIVSGQAGLLGWYFYLEVRALGQRMELRDRGYITIEKTKLVI